ncbi:hypothetical protein N1851_016764 [Merluccius polli]|uniref:Peptidase A2 domain-containing protein n=1 Tax=Merluccius polli TaxID=89951 RepID=A0AA47MQL3_MERPO|nr:hypothetical protein N1851_016764 [Merluccius polli]
MRTPPPPPTSQPASTADDDTSLVPDILVGRASVGESCYISVTVEGVPCLALVDSGATVSLVRPDVVPGGIQLEPTAKWLRTVTGELAPLTGKSRFSVTIGGWAVRHLLWIAAVQEPCILGLDFLKATGCVLDFGRGLVSFRGGPVVTMWPIDTPVTPPVRLFTPAGESIGAALNITPAASLPPATPTRSVGPSFTSTPPSASQLQPRGTVEAGVNSTPSGTTSTVHATTSRNSGAVISPDGIPPEIRRNWAGGSRSDRLASVAAGHAAFRRPGSPRQRTAARVRRRGRRGGVRQRLRRLGLRRLPLPSIILGNAQSLRNKVDELQANVKHISEYRDACVIALTETWLKDYDPTQDFDIDGFGQPYRLDRDAQITGKSLGGGVCFRPSRRGKLSAKRSLYGQRALFGN